MAARIRTDLVLQASLEAYGAIRHEGRLADRALDRTLRAKRHLYSGERRAVAEWVYALLRRQLLVDHLLGRARRGFATRPTSEQDRLRLSATRVLDGEPAELVAREVALEPQDRLALAQLSPALAALEGDASLEARSLRWSMPVFFARRLVEQLGSDAEAAATAMNQRAPLAIRANTLKTTRDDLMRTLVEDGLVVEPTSLSPLGIKLEGRVNVSSLPSFKEGLFEPQDEGSQLLGMLTDAPPTRVIDACAGAGGKSLQLSAQMKNRGELFALDIDERRLLDLKRRARRAGAHNIRAKAIDEADDSALASLGGAVDRVLVDAPCSGTGTFRRKPDARYRMTEADIAKYRARQLGLLSRFAPLVKPGGRLVYGTCSVLREENEEVVAEFLATHASFRLDPAERHLGAPGARDLTREGYLRLWPHLHDTDGFFGAVLVHGRR